MQGELRSFVEGTCAIAVKDTELALELGSIEPELEALLSGMIDAMATINGLA